MNGSKRYPVMGYAPGGYQCECRLCKTFFFGDRYAHTCEPCADAAQAEWDSLTTEQQHARINENHRILQELLKQNKDNE